MQKQNFTLLCIFSNNESTYICEDYFQDEDMVTELTRIKVTHSKFKEMNGVLNKE